jgi:hypothetical protein
VVALAVLAWGVSRVVTTSVVGRHKGTDRGRCSRRVRTSYALSKDGDARVVATRFSPFRRNCCRAVRTLRVRGEDGRWRERSPALVASLTGHVWSPSEWPADPAVQRR